MVRDVPDKTGRFSRRPHYKPEELDRECEAVLTKFLRDRHGKVDFPVSTDDILVLIEQRVEDLDPYADLSVYGDKVEGVTEFFPGGKPSVKISAKLANDDRRENRLRTTLTHEFGHVHFHAYLWEIEPPGRDLLRQNPNANKQICKRDDILNAAQSDWMEWQAGYVCGALLMPVTHVRRIVSVYQEKHSLYGTVDVNGVHGQTLIQGVQEQFQVSGDAARVRLIKLNILGLQDMGPSLFS